MAEVHMLYLAYSYPPINLVAAQRAFFQTRYLSQSGAKVTVLCALYTDKHDDHSLLEQFKDTDNLKVIAIRPWLYFWKDSQYKAKRKISKALKFSGKGFFWLLRARLLAFKLMKKTSFEIIYSTYGPRYPHFLARSLVSKFPIPWIAEFRDLWAGRLSQATSAKGLVRAFERWTVKPAARFITVSSGLADELKRIHGPEKACDIIYNGFEPSRYLSPAEQKPSVESTKVLLLSGTVYRDQLESLRILFSALKQLHNNKVLPVAIRFQYIGASHQEIQEMIRSEGVDQVATAHPRVSSAEIIQHQMAANAFVLPVSNDYTGAIPVKFFDYLAARKPTLMLNGEGTEVKEVLDTTDSGINAQDTDDVITFLKRICKPDTSFTFVGVDAYTREEQAKKLLTVINDIISEHHNGDTQC